MRLIALVLALTGLLLIPFLIWGGTFERALSFHAGVAWLRSWGPLGGVVVIALLVADLFLPVPATPLMSATGYLYGTVIGGLLSASGSFLSGALAYALCRKFGHGLARRLAGDVELQRAEKYFARRGAWLVALSRWLPLLPEAIACMAGLTRMPSRVFVVALLCGCVPMGFVYAAIGAAGGEHPRLALALSAIVPAILWAMVQLRWNGRRNSGHDKVGV
ncbi:MAG TPA: VTT domain-containing protein [Chthoniobacteraceae bacterium]|nr:VTT domain-containing protein [Chthoniobacteraceae bacterium]